MKTRLVTLFLAFSLFHPLLGYSQEEWKVYPFYYKNDTLSLINALAPMQDGGVLTSPWTKLCIFKGDSFQRIANPYQTPEYFRIHRMQPDSKGTIWLNTLGGLAKYTKSEGFQKVSKLDYGGTKDYKLLNGLTVDNNDNVWFFNNTQYITKFDGTKFTDYDYFNLALPYYNTNRLIVKDSILRYACPAGLCEATIHANDSTSYKILSLSDLQFTGRSIKLLQFDKLGNLYATSDTNELSVCSNGKWESINIPDSLKAHGANWAYKYIKNIVPIKDGQIYLFWSLHNFFCKYDRKTDIWEKIDIPKELGGTVDIVAVGAAAFDSEGYLWISTADHGLFRYKPEGTGTTDGGYGAENHALDAWIERIYPNPTRGNILKARAFLLPDGQDNVTAYFSDILGNKLIEFSDPISINPTTGEANLEYSLEELPNGAYLFVLQKGISIRAKNFVKID